MNKVLCFGEALIDFLGNGSTQSEGLAINQFNQFPGGAPANAAVAVSKLGGEAAFIGQVGDDMFGHYLIHALSHYGVDTQYVARSETAKTALAFVALDENGERSFSFYRDKSADMLYQAHQCAPCAFEGASLFHFCSNTLTDGPIANTTCELIDHAIAKGLTVSFDVNLRHNLWPSGKACIETVNRFVDKAQVLKFSLEEIVYLTDDIDSYVQRLLSSTAMLILITNDGNPIRYYTKTMSGELAAPCVNVVDTTAGGDGFSGGLLYQLANVPSLSELTKSANNLKEIVSFASACGALAVTRPGAFPALGSLEEVNAFRETI